MRTVLATLLTISAGTTCFADLKFHIIGRDDRVVYVHGERIRTENPGNGEATIRQCDLGRTVQLDPTSKTYRVFSFTSAPQVGENTSVSDSGLPRAGRRIELEEAGAGEFQGKPAKHLRIFIYLVPRPSPDHPNVRTALVQERDGWYVEIPPMPECGPKGKHEEPGMRAFDRPDRFARTDGSITPELLPVLVDVKVRGKGQNMEVAHTVEVVSLSTDPLDPKLFDIPPDYQPAKDPDCTHGPAVVARLEDGTPVYRTECGVTPPQVTYQTEPEFSERARKRKISGTVDLSCVVDQFGKVREIKVEQSADPALDKNAIAAVSQWKFQPATKDGQSVAVQMNVQVSFRLY
jgi:TonB family protein